VQPEGRSQPQARNRLAEDRSVPELAPRHRDDKQGHVDPPEQVFDKPVLSDI